MKRLIGSSGGGTPGGSNTQVQFNNGGAFGGDAGLVFDKTTDALTIAGPVVHPIGAAATPSLTFTGDPNTGIYSPGADTLALSTGGTERIRIDSSGRLGLGTSSPSNTAGFSQQFEIAGTVPCISINQNNAGFTTRKYSLSVNTTGDFGIWDNTASAYRMYINTSGNVGIGTSSPTTLLDVNADTIRVRTARTPASASATGATGEICWDASYIYVCTATNTWKRTAISTW